MKNRIFFNDTWKYEFWIQNIIFFFTWKNPIKKRHKNTSEYEPERAAAGKSKVVTEERNIDKHMTNFPPNLNDNHPPNNTVNK
jgi:hypothetical protein